MPARPPFKRPLGDLIRPGTNSVCLICSHIFYGVVMPQCSRCGGAIHLASEIELRTLLRHRADVLEEKDGL